LFSWRYYLEAHYPKTRLIQVRVDKNDTAATGRALLRVAVLATRNTYQ